MGRCKVVDSAKERLPLSDGDWIDVKRDLNAGEYYDSLVSMADRQPFAKVLAYLLGWSFTDIDGGALLYHAQMPEDERRQALRSLRKQTVREIVAAIDRHEKAQDAAWEEKKRRPGTIARIESNLRICRAMNGWRYDWVETLPREVYDVLVAMLNREQQRTDPDDWLRDLDDDPQLLEEGDDAR